MILERFLILLDRWTERKEILGIWELSRSNVAEILLHQSIDELCERTVAMKQESGLHRNTS
jgi:hypothetical protein